MTSQSDEPGVYDMDAQKRVPPLHNPLAQALVFAGEQLLGEIVAALIGVTACPGKVIIDPRASGATEVMRKRENFRGWLACVDLGLSERTSGTHGKEFCRYTHESREQQLFAIEFRTEAHHGVE